MRDLVRRLRLPLGPFPEGATDAELLLRFTRHKDETAFAALVRRHGPLVLGVCRRVLKNAHDAEDAFQATFLVLARKAHSVRRPGSLPSWLYGVAHRTASHAKRDAARRRTKEARAAPPRPDPGHDDLVAVLDGAMACLPEKYREAVVLCDLQGKTRTEAARHMGCREGTVASRLARGRAMLARRLRRLGFGVTAAALAGLLSREATAFVPAHLAWSAVRGVSAAPAAVAALTQGVLKMMLIDRLRVIATAVLLVGLAAGTAVLAGSPAKDVPAVKGAAPAEGDAEFIRRACLEIRGSLPSDIEVHYFLRDKSPRKRAWLVEKLKEEGARAGKPAKAKAEAGPLEGTWAAVAYEQRGQRADAKVVDSMKVVFAGVRMTIYHDEKVIGAYTFRVEATAKPAVLVLTRADGPEEGRVYRGIYRREGERLTLCLNSQAGGPPPRAFQARADKPGPPVELVELRRVRP